MKTRWPIVLGSLVWVLVVSTGAAGVWAVISRVGSGAGAEQPLTTMASATAPAPAPSLGVPTPSTPPGSPSATLSPKPSPPVPPATRPTTTRTSTSAPTTHTTTTASPVPGPQIWTGTPGRVVARCSGDKVTGSASPEQGWQVSVERSSEAFKVEFKRAGSHDVEVEATCHDGKVRFDVSD